LAARALLAPDLDVLAALDEAFPLFEVLELLDEPLRLVDLFEPERLRVDRLLEDRVVWAMVIRLSWLLASCAFRTGGPPGLTR
jgi:hypothetical protein